ncbi:TIGR03084 family metal-binding protein [Streptosporangium sp. NBC_01639]|uniref:TIGR03084 family metal-binding protein n=1 Tax=unclassified Streptosporangium TaxID=2632669 RepID=UPI002DDB8884|nr:TIGR03084 family metal-binding protein [Streptosporangium sp. NBC_01756]WSC85360.1 TIGR03084 family metal-binding protein [Streptosporangium sp. NBC_01756]WTD56005.1 TIGR03084 family metal-binding protein [Streptosporangium sp. NBC_01639]
MSELQNVIQDLSAESAELDRLLADLPAPRWKEPTAAPGWTVAHQVGHLSFIFRIAGLAASDPDAFRVMAEPIEGGFNEAVNAALAEYIALPPAELLARWREERAAGLRALAAVPDGQVVPWLVRPLPPEILGSAGIMETFAHGQDILDALDIPREPTDRLRYLVIFAVLTWDFGYEARGMTPPDVQFRYELTAPSGELWAYGPETADQKIVGSALDFCLLVTRRRHRDDCDVTAVGPDADAWLDIAQAYRGPAGPGRQPGQFARIPA